MKVLLVEDDDDCVATFIEVAQDVCEDISIISAKTAKDAISLLKEDFDVAIVDLRLDENSDGNEFISSMQKLGLKIPTVIHTGTPDDVNPNLNALKVYKRSEVDYAEILNYLLRIFETGITEIIGLRGEIETQIQLFYKDSFVKNSELWMNRAALDKERVKRSLLRSLLNRFESDIHDPNEKSYAEEFYIPSKQECLYTGSIVKAKDSTKTNYVVLSPSCDLVVRSSGRINVNTITLCKIESVKDYGVEYKFDGDQSVLSNSKKEKIEPYIENKKNLSHWMPRTIDYEGGVINFTMVSSAPYSDFFEKFTIAGVRISPVFMKNILSRFSSYYARQGQPDLNVMEIIDEMKAHEQ
ncbi:MAG: response regulator [Fibrobacter sp.]|nr:response regulator [Fibrobacter sp.]